VKRDVACVLALAATAIVACAPSRGEVVRVVPPVEAAPDVRAVPVGTEATIALVDELSTEWSVPGQLFRAVLVDNLTAANGSIVVRAGTLVYGVVVDVRSGAEPLLAIDIPAVETADGTAAAFEARLKEADGKRGIDALLLPSHAGGATAYPNAPAHYDPDTNEIRVPAGGRLRLVLASPLKSRR
jgi:hypothetical protein